MGQWCITMALCTWGRTRGQSGISVPGHRSFRPPGVKIDIPMMVMMLNLLIKIWTPFIYQDGDKNYDYVKEASNSYSMKPALVLLIGIHPNCVGQYYANYSQVESCSSMQRLRRLCEVEVCPRHMQCLVDEPSWK